MKTYATITSIASYIPSHCVTNKDFERTLDTSDEWILKRTGIQTRYFASSNELTSDLASKAGSLAIQRANISQNDIDAVVVATLSPDYFTMPSTACITSHKLGIYNKPAFDISAACSGFIYLLGLAKSFIESGVYRQILIIGAEKTSSVLDFSDRGTCVLFGDGAGACVVSATNDKNVAIVDVHLGANGEYQDFLCTPRQQSQINAPLPVYDGGFYSSIQMKGNEVFKLAVNTLTSEVREILDKNSISPSDITYFIPHQANLRIIKAVGEKLSFKPQQIIITVQKYGNTSAASVPMAMNDVYEEGRLKYGDLLLLDAFGGGLTWGSALVHYGGK